jgi:hypothetical protein
MPSPDDAAIALNRVPQAAIDFWTTRLMRRREHGMCSLIPLLSLTRPNAVINDLRSGSGR